MAENDEKKAETRIGAEKLKEINDGIAQIRLQPWEALPDLALYMDQVLQYMPRQKLEITPDDILTASMVSNYVKSGIMPGASGKRYNREHLVYLTAIQMLKQVLSVRNTGELIRLTKGKKDAQVFYEEYTALMEKTLSGLNLLPYLEGSEMPGGGFSPEAIGAVALQFAIMSYSGKLVCERLLELARREKKDAEELLAEEARAAKEKSREKNKEKSKDKEIKETKEAKESKGSKEPKEP